MGAITTLLETPLLTVVDIDCALPRGGPGAERDGEPPHLALMRHGGFGYHLGRRAFLADPATAVYHPARHAYRISHPLRGGDRCTAIVCREDMEEELFGADACGGHRPELPVTPALQLAHLRLVHSLPRETSLLAREERVLELLLQLRLHASRVGTPAARLAAGRLVREARALLTAALDRNVSLSELTGTLAVSPGHLMRTFRAHTGLSLRGYRRRLRVLGALERLAQGERDLTGLALDLGFASHGHLDACFARELGLSPSQVRRELAGYARSRVRTFVEARVAALD